MTWAGSALPPMVFQILQAGLQLGSCVLKLLSSVALAFCIALQRELLEPPSEVASNAPDHSWRLDLPSKRGSVKSHIAAPLFKLQYLGQELANPSSGQIALRFTCPYSLRSFNLRVHVRELAAFVSNTSDTMLAQQSAWKECLRLAAGAQSRL
jgi:hypothetical protein